MEPAIIDLETTQLNTIEDSEFIDRMEKEAKKYNLIFKIKRRKFAMTVKQRDQFLSFAYQSDPQKYLMYRLGLEAGLRSKEIVFLPVKHCHLNSENAKIEVKSYAKDKNFAESFKVKTVSSERIVYIGKNLADSLKMVIGNRKTGLVFQSREGRDYRFAMSTRQLRRYANIIAKKCPLINHNIGLHVLRRTYASDQLKNGIELTVISRNLGHKKIKTTFEYLLHIEDEESKIKSSKIAEKSHNIQATREIKSHLAIFRSKQDSSNKRKKNALESKLIKLQTKIFETLQFDISNLGDLSSLSDRKINELLEKEDISFLDIEEISRTISS